MRKSGLFVFAGLIALAGVLLVGRSGSAQGAGAAPVDVLIQFRDTPGPAEQGLVRAFGGVVRGSYEIVPAVAATVPQGALNGLARHPAVVLVEPDTLAEAHDLADADSSVEVTNAWGVDRLDADKVWPVAGTGAGVGIAVLDTGSGPHNDLPAAAGRWNCLSGTVVPGGNDDNGHGSHTAGSILAVLGNGGVAGVAPGASLHSYKVLDRRGSGPWSGIIAAMDHVRDVNAGPGGQVIHVVNMSLGSSFNPGSIVQQACDNLYGSGVLVVASAGNSGNKRGAGDNIGYPARYDSVVAVGATDNRDRRASYSSTGPALELAAPGSSVISCWLNNQYASISGTSMAAPHVSGAAALLFAAGVGPASQVRSVLTSTALDLGAAGRDSLYGHGLVDPHFAVVGSRH